MLKKIELVSDKKLDNKTLNKIKGGWCCCASCVCGTESTTNWFKDSASTDKNNPLPPPF